MSPVAGYAEVAAGIILAVLALTQPVVWVLRRLNSIEKHLAEMRTDMQWVKRALRMGEQHNETAAHS